MYIIKTEELKNIKKTNRQIANILGVTEGYISQIKRGKKPNISKMMAYSFCKAIDSDFEIENLFEII